FGTAVATATGLRADWGYRYDILYRHRRVSGGTGHFRTMPPSGSMADVLFVTLSCAHTTKLGAWQLLERYVGAAKPRFLLMIGDQVYLDEGADVWRDHLRSSPEKRRAAMAQRYCDAWAKEPVRTL